MPTFFFIPTTQLNLIISKNNEKGVLPTDSFLSSLSRVEREASAEKALTATWAKIFSELRGRDV